MGVGMLGQPLGDAPADGRISGISVIAAGR